MTAIVRSSAIIALALSIGCASATQNVDTTVTKVASYGQRASQILKSSQQVVIKATPSPIPQETAAEIMKQYVIISNEGDKLVQALEAYDLLASDDVSGRMVQISEIQMVMQNVRRYTRVVLVFVGNQEVGKELLTLYDNVDSIFMEVEKGFLEWRNSQMKQ
jgi:hypothetical protein